MTNEPTSRDLARQKLILRIVIGALVVMAVLAIVAVPRLRLPVRLFVASTDLIAAAVLWLLLRQKFGGK
jgi:hypothetical protein